jgi:CubicO group peptidase (beta-lactamase class C family)
VNQPKRLRFVIGLCLAAVSCGIALAQTPKAPPNPLAPKESAKPAPAATAPGAGVHELTSTDLESFFDGFLPQQIIKGDIAGVVITIVKDGKPIFEKGYGYSDVATKKPVSPQDTLFRPGSISKTFTWTAVMQQVELGKLNLDADVNQYLDFKLPANFGKPTTLRDIMTHRGGFEETIKDLFVLTEKELTPMAQYLPTHIPHQIYPPGTISAYSNYAPRSPRTSCSASPAKSSMIIWKSTFSSRWAWKKRRSASRCRTTSNRSCPAATRAAPIKRNRLNT